MFCLVYCCSSRSNLGLTTICRVSCIALLMRGKTKEPHTSSGLGDITNTRKRYNRTQTGKKMHRHSAAALTRVPIVCAYCCSMYSMYLVTDIRGCARALYLEARDLPRPSDSPRPPQPGGRPLVIHPLSSCLLVLVFLSIPRVLVVAKVNMRHEVALQVATSSPNARKERKSNFNGGLDSCPCLVLNADYQPLSYLPLR